MIQTIDKTLRSNSYLDNGNTSSYLYGFNLYTIVSNSIIIRKRSTTNKKKRLNNELI